MSITLLFAMAALAQSPTRDSAAPPTRTRWADIVGQRPPTVRGSGGWALGRVESICTAIYEPGDDGRGSLIVMHRSGGKLMMTLLTDERLLPRDLTDEPFHLFLPDDPQKSGVIALFTITNLSGRRAYATELEGQMLALLSRGQRITLNVASDAQLDSASRSNRTFAISDLAAALDQMSRC